MFVISQGVWVEARAAVPRVRYFVFCHIPKAFVSRLKYFAVCHIASSEKNKTVGKTRSESRAIRTGLQVECKHPRIKHLRATTQPKAGHYVLATFGNDRTDFGHRFPLSF